MKVFKGSVCKLVAKHPIFATNWKNLKTTLTPTLVVPILVTYDSQKKKTLLENYISLNEWGCVLYVSLNSYFTNLVNVLKFAK